MVKLIKKINTDLIIFLSIFSVIFLTIGNHKIDYKSLIVLKFFLILIMLKKNRLFSKLKDLIFKQDSTVVLIILFVISISISFLFSPLQIEQFSIELSGIRYLYTITNILFFCTLFIYFSENEINYSYLFYSIVIPCLIFSFYIFIIFIQNKGIGSSADKKLLFFSNIRQIGLYLTFVTCCSLGFWISEIKNIDEKKIIFFLFIFLTITILLGNRGSLISIILSFIFLVIILSIKKIKISKKIIIFLLCIFFAYCLKEIIIFLINSGTAKIYDDQLDFEIVLAKDVSFNLIRIDANSIHDRLAMWAYGIELIKKYPIFGLGSNGFFIQSINEKYNTGYPVLVYYSNPHNFIIQFLVEWGLIGSLIIFSLFGKIFFKILKTIFKSKKKLYLIPLLSFFGPTMQGLIDGNFYNSVSSFFIVMSLSLLMVEIKKNN